MSRYLTSWCYLLGSLIAQYQGQRSHAKYGVIGRCMNTPGYLVLIYSCLRRDLCLNQMVSYSFLHWVARELPLSPDHTEDDLGLQFEKSCLFPICTLLSDKRCSSEQVYSMILYSRVVGVSFRLCSCPPDQCQIRRKSRRFIYGCQPFDLGIEAMHILQTMANIEYVMVHDSTILKWALHYWSLCRSTIGDEVGPLRYKFSAPHRLATLLVDMTTNG